MLARVRHGLGDRAGAQAAFAGARAGLASCPEPGPVLTDLSAATRRWIQDPARATRPVVTGAALTERELDVLRLFPQALSQREIAAALHVSPNTVKTHSAGIFRKLGVTGRAAVVARGRDLGLL